jgi:hypothetical protein
MLAGALPDVLYPIGGQGGDDGASSAHESSGVDVLEGISGKACPSGRRSRGAVAAIAAVLATAALAGPAGAAITTGPVDPASGFPFSYTDDLGTSLELCQDVSGFCVETPRPNPAARISVPDNFTPDEEGFWWLADATVPNAGRGLARFAKEAAFDTPGINQGHQVEFSRIRFRFDGLISGATYRITHPYGVDEIEAEPNPKGGGLINFTEDIGCLAAPCGTFPALPSERITSFLTWDPTVAPAAPAGYVGNGVTPHAVIGSPLDTNFVRLERLSGPGGGVVETIGETNQFIVQGKLAGPPPPPAPHIGLDRTSLSFPNRQVGSPSGPQRITVSNHGTADLFVSGVAVTGTDAADFATEADGCSGRTIAPAESCTVDVRFAPAHTGALSALLHIADNAPNAPHDVALSGVGLAGSGSGSSGAAPSSASGSAGAAPAPAAAAALQSVPLVAVAGIRARSLAVSALSAARRISAARLRRQGLRAVMRLPAGTAVVRFAVYRARNGRRAGRALAIGYRLPSRSGFYRLVLRDRALLRRLTRGRYVLQIRAGRSRSDLGATATIAFTVTR